MNVLPLKIFSLDFNNVGTILNIFFYIVKKIIFSLFLAYDTE